MGVWQRIQACPQATLEDVPTMGSLCQELSAEHDRVLRDKATTKADIQTQKAAVDQLKSKLHKTLTQNKKLKGLTDRLKRLKDNLVTLDMRHKVYLKAKQFLKCKEEYLQYFDALGNTSDKGEKAQLDKRMAKVQGMLAAIEEYLRETALYGDSELSDAPSSEVEVEHAIPPPGKKRKPVFPERERTSKRLRATCPPTSPGSADANTGEGTVARRSIRRNPTASKALSGGEGLPSQLEAQALKNKQASLTEKPKRIGITLTDDPEQTSPRQIRSDAGGPGDVDNFHDSSKSRSVDMGGAVPKVPLEEKHSLSETKDNEHPDPVERNSVGEEDVNSRLSSGIEDANRDGGLTLNEHLSGASTSNPLPEEGSGSDDGVGDSRKARGKDNEGNQDTVNELVKRRRGKAKGKNDVQDENEESTVGVVIRDVPLEPPSVAEGSDGHLNDDNSGWLKTKKENTCNRIINEYLRNPDSKILEELDGGLCAYIRGDARRVRLAAVGCRQVVLWVLTTNKGKGETTCIYYYYANKQKGLTHNDITAKEARQRRNVKTTANTDQNVESGSKTAGEGAEPSTGKVDEKGASEELNHKHLVTGIPQKKSSSPLPGYCHCGCSIDDAVCSFILWKTLQIQSVSTGNIEGWGQGTRQGPRDRTFLLQAVKKYGHLDTDDLFEYRLTTGKSGKPYYTKVGEAALVDAQIENLLKYKVSLAEDSD